MSVVEYMWMPWDVITLNKTFLIFSQFNTQKLYIRILSSLWITETFVNIMVFIFDEEEKTCFVKCEEIDQSIISVNCCFIHSHITQIKVKLYSPSNIPLKNENNVYLPTGSERSRKCQ